MKQSTHTQGEMKMKQIIRTVTALVVVAGLNLGCGKKEQPTPEAAAAPKAGDTANWEPESVEQPKGHSHDDGHDHSGHSH